MARRKRDMSEPPTDTDSPDELSSSSILGSMLSLDEEMSQQPTKSPRKSHIPIYDPAKEPSPTKSPRPPKRKSHPPPPDNDGAILQQESVFESTTHHANDDGRPPKPAAVRLDFPNNVTATPPPHLTQSEREPAASPKKAKAPKGYASLHKASPVSQTPHIKSDHRSEAPDPTNSSSVNVTSPAAAADSTEGNDIADFDDQIAIVMKELEALNLLHSQLLEAKVKAKEYHHRKHQSSAHITSADAPPVQTTFEPPPQAISNPKSPRRLGTVTNKDEKPVPQQGPAKSPKKPRQLRPDAAIAPAGLPPLNAYPMAAVQDAYPWSKFMLQQMHQQMMQSPHHVHGASTPVVYVPILNPAYMAEVKHPPSDKQTKPTTDTVPAPPTYKAPDEVAPAEATTAIVAKSPDKPPKPRTMKKASPKRPTVVKKHTSRELVFPSNGLYFDHTSCPGKMRVSRPHDELAVCNGKYVKDCTELVMSGRDIDVIGNFDAFVSLEVLWLNNNNIETITGLDNCFRIKYLYLQNNRIASLEGSLLRFSFLKELRLYNNKLQDLHTTLKLLEKLVHLEDLDLFGNPLAEEDKYRLHVIASIPSLQVFDRHVVTPEEQLSAKKLSIKRSGHSTSAAPHARHAKASTAERYAPLSGTVKMLLKDVANIEREKKHADELARKKCFDLMAETSLGPGPTSPHTNDSSKSMARSCGMDEWVFCHLRKTFRSLDTKKLGGILGTQLPSLVSEMLDQGHQIIWKDEPLTEESDITALIPLLGKAIGPDPDDDDEKPRHVINWAAFSQAIVQKHVGPNQDPFHWASLGLAALAERAEDYFDKAKALQKKLALLTAPNNELKQQVHVYSQRGYHLTTLKDQLASSSKHELVLHQEQQQTVPSVLRDSVSLYSYKTKGAKPHDDDGAKGTAVVSLAKKYDVKSKDFRAFLDAKEARKPVRVTKESFAV